VLDGLTHFIERNPIFAALLFFMVMDIVTGLLAAGVERKLSSPISYSGMLRKFLIISMVVTAQGMDWLALSVYKVQAPIAGFVIIAFLVREILSIIENCARGGLPVPDQIKDRLAVFTQGDLANSVFAITGGVIQTASADPHAISNVLHNAGPLNATTPPPAAPGTSTSTTIFTASTSTITEPPAEPPAGTGPSAGQ
jgi:toxin secretion/phage lysis holin